MKNRPAWAVFQVCGSYGRAPLVEWVTLDEMAERYRKIINGCKEKAVNKFN